MLEVARAKLPKVELHADLRSMPLPAESIDLVVCTVALTHLPHLVQPFAEFARVLRPGGAAVLSNTHHLSLPLGGVVQTLTSVGNHGLPPIARIVHRLTIVNHFGRGGPDGLRRRFGHLHGIPPRAYVPPSFCRSRWVH
jgi:ubiquinone/menaquinone biosynthesis C-methylase UbiE